MSYDLEVLNGDLVISSNGDFSQITDTDKLQQDLIKIATTTAGANVLQPWYGSLIGRSLIGSYLASDTIISIAKSQLQNAVTNLQNLQKIQVSSGQPVSPAEQISFINDISIVRSTVDPRIFNVVIKVFNRAFGRIAASFVVNNT